MSRLRQPSYKGVPFFTQDQFTGKFGRRQVGHLYPFTDTYYHEDLGRAPKNFRITACFFELSDAEKMIKACESAGAGAFVHPWGQVQQMVLKPQSPAQVTYPKAEGGLFTIELDLEETGANQQPDVTDDLTGQLFAALDEAQAAIDAVFDSKWLDEVEQWIDAATNCVDKVCDRLEMYLAPARRALSQIERMKSGIGGIIGRPMIVAARIRGLINAVYRIADVSTLPIVGGAQLSTYRAPIRTEALQAAAFSLSGSSATANKPRYQNSNFAYVRGDILPVTNLPRSTPAWAQNAAQNGVQIGALSGTTTTTEQRAERIRRDWPALPASLSNFIRQTELIERVATIPTAQFASSAELATVRDQVMAQLDFELLYSDDALYEPMNNVRISAHRMMAELLPLLRDVDRIQTGAVLPALVLVYNQTGAIDALDDFLMRNDIAHPGFVSAGSYDVLRGAAWTH